MTTEVNTPTQNRVIVVGMLDTMLVRDRTARRDKVTGRANMIEVTRKEGRARGTRGMREELVIQARSPYGGMFALKIELEPDVPGAALLESAEAETLLTFEGTLQLKQTFDPRFASDTQDARGRLDRGRPTRAMQLLVSSVREPNDQERRASSGVWLEGVISEPPQIARHPDLPSVQLAGTILQVSFARPVDFPGLGALIDESVDVNIAVPTSYAQAEILYRQGNRVRIAGQLDCRMERQGGLSVQTKLAEIDRQWSETKASLVGNITELRRAERIYRSQRMRIEEAPRLFVLILSAELIDGAPMALEETYGERQEFVRNRRQQQAARRARTASDQERRASERAAHGGERAGSSDAAGINPVQDDDTITADESSRPARPRRQLRVTIPESASTEAELTVLEPDSEVQPVNA
ncbi:MAG TPA: hypothetical protein VKE41_18190 [Roseiflexaceae bacterium]|nr:hypothetical protein [Roseiflexaceae bacterium]